VPTQQDIPRLLALRETRRRGGLARNQNAALTEIERRFQQIAEPAAAMATGMLAEPVSGIVGMAALPFGADVAANAVRNTQQGLTYQPRTEAGQQGMQALQGFMQPIAETVSRQTDIASKVLAGNAGFDVNTPGGQFLTGMLPALAASAPGFTAARAIPGRQFEMGDIGAGGVGSRQRGMFAGVRAKTADFDALDNAKNMEGQGATRDQIWNETGWFKDVDGQWKFEIDDSGSELTPNAMESSGSLPLSVEMGDAPRPAPFDSEVGDFIRHQELYDNYPQISEYGLEDTSGPGGSFQPFYSEILDDDTGRIKVGTGQSASGRRSTALHEVQHAVQSREGFAKGGNQETVRFAMDDIEAQEKRPLFGAVNELESLSRRMEQLGKADYIESLNKIIRSDRPSPSSVTNMSDFYRYSDEIRSMLGAMPKKPGAPRDEWLKGAAQYIRRKNIDEMDNGTEMSVREMIKDPAQVKRNIRKLERQRDKLIPKVRKFQDVDRRFNDLKGMEDFDLYQRLAGEAEARNVQTRRDFTPQQRRASTPWSTLDVPENELIIRRTGGNKE
jgi:hypothetical protein